MHNSHRNSGLGTRPEHPSFKARQRNGREQNYGARSLVYGSCTFVGGMLTTALVGLTIVPMEARFGRTLLDTPPWYQLLVAAAGLSMLAWTGLGIAALTFAVISLRRESITFSAIAGAFLALTAPVTILASFTPLMLLSAVLFSVPS